MVLERTPVTAYQYPSAASPYPAAPATDPTAVMARRTFAFIIDVLLFTLIASFFGPTPLSPFALYEKVPANFDYNEACDQLMRSDDVAACSQVGDRVYYIDDTDAIVASLVTLAYFLLIPVLLQGLKGFTPGKGIMGVRTVDEQGQVPGIGKALVRSLMWIVDAAPWVIPLVAPIVAFTSKGHRRVGDMAAKTFVIGKADVGRPVSVPGLTTAYSAGYGVPGGYPPPGQPGQPGQPGPTPWDQPAPGGAAPVPGQAPVPGAWGAPTAPPGGSAPGAPGQPWNAPAPQGSPWAPPSTPSGSTTPSGGWPTPGGPAPSPTPSGESPAGTPGGSSPSPTPSGESPAAPGSAIPLGAVGSTGPSTDSPPSGEPGASAAPSPGEPASGPGALSGPAATPSGESPAATGQQQAGSGYEPQWDAARNTYILWEPNRRQWLGWDDSAKEWRPL